MWCFAQWVMERMCGLWTPKVKLKAKADRNLALVLLRDAQLYNLHYAVDPTKLANHTTHPILTQLFEGQNPHDNDISSELYQASLHAPVKKPVTLTYRQVKHLKGFLVDRGHRHTATEELGDALKAARRGCRGTVPDSTPTPIKVSVFQQLAINDFSAEQALFNAFVRSSRYGKDGAHDATHMRYAYEDTKGRMRAGFGRALFYFIYKVEQEEGEPEGDEGGGNDNGGRQRFYLLACIEDLKHNQPDRHGLTSMAALPASGGAPQQIVDADPIEALMGVVYKEKEAFFVARDSCFLG